MAKSVKSNKEKEVMYGIYDNGEMHVRISRGNVKVGNIPQFNTLPGNDLIEMSNGKILTNIVGTCGKCCDGCFRECYAVRSLKLHHNSTTVAWGTNTVILRNDPDKILNEITEYCTKNIVKYFRFHTSGELESVGQLKLYCEICKRNPDVVFYTYTKNFDALVEYFTENPVPENFVINLSEWHGNIAEYMDGIADTRKGEIANILFNTKMNVFSYDDGESGCAKEMVHCPAIDSKGHETGVTCAMCRRCMKMGNRTAVYAH